MSGHVYGLRQNSLNKISCSLLKNPVWLPGDRQLSIQTVLRFDALLNIKLKF